MAQPPIDFAAALRLFDETTASLAAQVARLEQILVAKQAELVEANARRVRQSVTGWDRERIARA